MPAESRRVIVAITGATGAVFGIRMLERLRAGGVETHLVISAWGARTIEHETGYTPRQVRALADASYGPGDQAARISSGSFLTDGMVVAPCSMRTLAAVATGGGDTLVARAADVVIKEGRKLVLLARETPLSAIHLEHMLKLARLGIVVMPPVPAFYNHPKTLQDAVDHLVVRALDQLGLGGAYDGRWDGDLRRGGHMDAEGP